MFQGKSKEELFDEMTRNYVGSVDMTRSRHNDPTFVQETKHLRPGRVMGWHIPFNVKGSGMPKIISFAKQKLDLIEQKHMILINEVEIHFIKTQTTKSVVLAEKFNIYSYAIGYGASNRAMCLGLLYPRPEQIDDLVAVATESGRITHNHPVGNSLQLFVIL